LNFKISKFAPPKSSEQKNLWSNLICPWGKLNLTHGQIKFGPAQKPNFETPHFNQKIMSNIEEGFIFTYAKLFHFYVGLSK
jgi:hypothetical protein